MPTQEIILAGVTAFVITALLGPLMIPVLKKLKFGQSILEEGPSWHKSKQGIPTMGGILFGVGILAAFLIAGYGYYMHGDVTVLAALVLALVFGAIGFCDDYIKVKKKRNLGLTAMQKLVLPGARHGGVSDFSVFPRRDYHKYSDSVYKYRARTGAGVLYTGAFADCGHGERGEFYRRAGRSGCPR